MTYTTRGGKYHDIYSDGYENPSGYSNYCVKCNCACDSPCVSLDEVHEEALAEREIELAQQAKREARNLKRREARAAKRQNSAPFLEQLLAGSVKAWLAEPTVYEGDLPIDVEHVTEQAVVDAALRHRGKR